MIKQFYAESKKTYLLPRGVAATKFAPSLPKEEIRKEMNTSADKRIIICVANFVPVKGIELLVEAFDSIKNQYPNWNVWSKIEEMPVELHQYAAVAFDDTLFISGGKHNTNSESTSDFWMYSLTANSWTKLPNMNYKRSNHVMIRSNSKIYFFGDKLPIDKVECYDIITQTFQVITNLSTTHFSRNQLVFKNEFFINNEKTQPAFHSFELDTYKLMWGYFCNIDIHKCLYDSIYMYKT